MIALFKYLKGCHTEEGHDLFELDSCNAQGVGLDGLVGLFQLYYSMIL